MSHQFKVGDSVVLKPNQKDVDTGADISGWQARVKEVQPEHGNILLQFDSITLKNLPPGYVEQGEEAGFAWSEYYLSPDDIEPATPRDTLADVDRVIGRLQSEYAWIHLGPEGRAIAEILKGVDLGW
ncbi:hypothetical protein QUF64_16170 [Anaerolineales bacterium HSG6]|nr:hypothetical protein [Anaerolineales bacterium HSG6]